MNEALVDLKISNQRYGNNQTAKALEQFQILANDAIKNKSLKAAKELTSQINSFDFAIIDQANGVAMDISFIKTFDDEGVHKNKRIQSRFGTEFRSRSRACDGVGGFSFSTLLGAVVPRFRQTRGIASPYLFLLVPLAAVVGFLRLLNYCY